jgi:hypothetical protein
MLNEKFRVTGTPQAVVFLDRVKFLSEVDVKVSAPKTNRMLIEKRPMVKVDESTYALTFETEIL